MTRQAPRHHRRLVIAGVIVTVAATGVVAWMLPSNSSGALGPEGICRERTFEGAEYVVCELSPRDHSIGVFQNEMIAGEATVPGFMARRLGRHPPVLVAMNGGMYREDLSPLGLLIEEGLEVAPINLAEADGNFYMKPNGVFFITRDGDAGVMPSEAFDEVRQSVLSATQSGPLLVQNGLLHPDIQPNGRSRHIRNGVGVKDDGTVVLAISREPVSFGALARALRDEFDCPDALYLDGFVSALVERDGLTVGGDRPAGPIIAVSQRR